ncbi:MAG: hydrolase [Planctomycetota bacterium]|nr:MAG: hydrolase [Planctomycetota bacterium]
MDSLTQIALGAAVGHAVLGRKLGRRALVYGALLGTLPDLDVLVPMGGAIENFTYHRGASHSWLVHSAVAPLFAWGLARLHRAREISLGRWICFVWSILFTHALLDVFTVYGTQVFWPLTTAPLALGSIFIIDPLYTLPLLVGCVLAWRRKLAPGATRGVAVGLILSTLYLLWSLGAQRLVLSEAQASLAARGLPRLQVLATPAFFNTLLWRLVTIDGERYFEGFYSLVDGAPVEWHERPREASLVAPLASEWSLQRLQWFTHGFWAVEHEGDDLVLVDLRMGLYPNYVFRFRLGQCQGDGRVVPAPVERRRRPFDTGRLAWGFSRIWTPTP